MTFSSRITSMGHDRLLAETRQRVCSHRSTARNNPRHFGTAACHPLRVASCGGSTVGVESQGCAARDAALGTRYAGPCRSDRQGETTLSAIPEDRRRAAIIPPIRQEVLHQLERVSELAPEVRFGQLIASLAFIAAGPWDQTLWDLEDEQLLAALQQHVADLSLRQTTAGRDETTAPITVGELAAAGMTRR